MIKTNELPVSATDLLDIRMGENDADASTIRDYLKKLLSTLWDEGEGFSAKRPFGNSGWEYDLYKALAIAGVIKGVIEDGDVDLYEDQQVKANAAIRAAIQALQ